VARPAHPSEVDPVEQPRQLGRTIDPVTHLTSSAHLAPMIAEVLHCAELDAGPLAKTPPNGAGPSGDTEEGGESGAQGHGATSRS
jgi:hypothetical protein